MTIKSLRVSNCRIISHVELEPSPGFNLISGQNGSGKSSLLEAIYLLGTGRSFRSSSTSSVIKKGERSLIVSADIETESGQIVTVGMERGKSCNRLHIDRSPIKQLSRAAEILPIQIITPESINLVMGSPRGRRSFLDWGMFHVEHNFLSATRNYKKNLRQRNALLKRKKFSESEMSYWNKALSDAGEEISSYRANYLEELTELYQQKLSPRLGSLSEGEVGFSYRRGWRESATLCETLEQGVERERVVGHTLSGPHEADMAIKSGDGVAKNVLSRGQAKLLSVGLYLSQLSHLYRKTGKKGIVLFDDMFSELDHQNSLTILEYLIDSGHQVFATTTEGDVSLLNERDLEMFHVEHGGVSTVVKQTITA